MAIKPVPNRYKSFAFNGVNARTYGVYVTDVNVFNSAARAVDYVTIPGRNGAFALDHGRFENVTVKYSCAMGADSDTDFADAISDFRNILASAKGYQRLEDDMNPTEYRMAVFSKGIEAPTLNQQTATFDVEFSCKPQRFLKSGETAVSITSGDTITNPTLFDASPMLVIDGNGTVDINGDEIELGTDLIGAVTLATPATGGSGGEVKTALTNTNLLNNGDSIMLDSGSTFRFSVYGDYNVSTPQQVSNVTVSGALSCSASAQLMFYLQSYVQFEITVGQVVFSNGTTSAQVATIEADIAVGGYPWVTKHVSIDLNAEYNSISNTVRLVASNMTFPTPLFVEWNSCELKEITGDSTKPALSGTTHIDLDIGEAYQIVNDEPISVNNAVSIPAKLPVLIPGTNTVTYDNTVTDMQIIPRWWRV